MPKKTQKTKKTKQAIYQIGFTIIEVVLVLAIAGLIFLMVFIALPMLQRNQRNTQREDDLARMLTAVTDYQSNNGGNTPFQNYSTNKLSNFVVRYIDSSCDSTASYSVYGSSSDNDCTADQFRDPDGTIYRFLYMGTFEDVVGNSKVDFAIGEPDRYEYIAHTIFVVSSAVCGPVEASIAKGSGERYVAMLTVLEGGGITCVTNGARGLEPGGDAGQFYLNIPM